MSNDEGSERVLSGVARLFGLSRLTRRMGLELVSSDDALLDRELGAMWRRCREYTMTSKVGLYALTKSAEYTLAARVPGSFVECGVWRGGSALALALTLVNRGATDRDLVLFDTFSGIPPPGPEDYDLRTGRNALLIWDRESGSRDQPWQVSHEEEVRSLVESSGLARDRVQIVRGRVEETMASHLPKSIALLRLDTNWYESTAAELDLLYPLLSQFGVLLVDDYGHWGGAKRALDEYRTKWAITDPLIRIDNTVRLQIKLRP